MTNYLDLTIVEINDLLKQKKIKPIDLVNEAINNIENSDLNAFITLNKEAAIQKAIDLENKEVDNILFGIPVAIKDNIVIKDLLTTCGSNILSNFIPPYNATVINKINDANMVIIGKTNMDEFAMGSTGETSYYGRVLNPVDKTKIPGGSSSGSAASVAGKLVPLALGSDTGGSIRQPAALTGIVGMKPTYGTVSRYGLVAFASSLDQIGPMTRSVYENALLLNIVAGIDEKDLTSANNKKDFTSLIGTEIVNKKIAVPNYYMSEAVSDVVKNNVEQVLTFLKEQGFIIEYIDMNYIEHAVHLYQVIALGEASSNLARFDGIRYGYKVDANSYQNLDQLYKETRKQGFGNEVKRRIMIGSYLLSSENAKTYYYQALKIRNEIKQSFAKVFETYDYIIGPTTTDVAYNLGEFNSDAVKSFYDDILAIPVNLAGLPAISIPINQQPLPIGLQIIGNHFEEDKLYQLAEYIEKRYKHE